ncbi:MAG: sigma-70 family RNA polymerase sigma factor [Phycisphaerales bacterium]|nr:sigma-70 family RNA polymerase sigma factor [Phycisphaerales bacterium]
MATATESSSPTPSFPETRTLWISDRLSEGEAGLILANGHVMSSYLQPLVTYCRALGLHTSIRGDPQEIVQGFFATRLSNTEYLKSWLGSGLRLRQWLRNGLHHFVHELRRDDAGQANATDSLDEIASTTKRSEDEFERAWALSALEQAMKETIANLERRGKRAEWDIFWMHHVDGHAYSVIAERHQMTAAQAAQRSFAVAGQVRNALYGILRKDGALTSEIGVEVAAMMEVLHEHGS